MESGTMISEIATQLLVGQIRIFQDHIIALEKTIEKQISFHGDVDRHFIRNFYSFIHSGREMDVQQDYFPT